MSEKGWCRCTVGRCLVCVFLTPWTAVAATERDDEIENDAGRRRANIDNQIYNNASATWHTDYVLTMLGRRRAAAEEGGEEEAVRKWR